MPTFQNEKEMTEVTRGGNGKRLPPPRGYKSKTVQGVALAEHVLAHFELQSSFVDKKCAIFDDCTKVGFHKY